MQNVEIWFFSIFKIVSLLSGLLAIYLGYRLFMNGLWGQAGDVNLTFKDTKVVIKSGAPGTFFAVLGAVILIITIAKGYNIKENVEIVETNNTLSHPNKVVLPDLPPISENKEKAND